MPNDKQRGLDLERMAKAIDEHLNNMTDEEIEKYFPKDTTPKGWVDIEDHLPMMRGIDIGQGFTEYRVKDQDGNKFETRVSDHNVWYYYAKEVGITHWFNE